MVAIAIANGALRESGYGQHLSELTAHQISTLTAVVLFGAYIWFVGATRGRTCIYQGN
jgi:hypothetical protein